MLYKYADTKNITPLFTTYTFTRSKRLVIKVTLAVTLLDYTKQLTAVR